MDRCGRFAADDFQVRQAPQAVTIRPGHAPAGPSQSRPRLPPHRMAPGGAPQTRQCRAAPQAQRAQQTETSLDKFEQESFVFFTRTRAAYLRRAEQSPERIAIIDSTQSLEQVKQQIQVALVARPALGLSVSVDKSAS